MTILLVVGATAEAGEADVARAIPGAEVLELLPAAEAVPMVAARHAGEELDPAALVARAREVGPAAGAGDGQHAGGPVVAAVAHGGLLAPLTPRYAIRDLAFALQASVVVAAPARAGALNAARLTVEAARGGGLTVAALVLTGWPDPPSRVQLDERALLHQLTGLPVLTLTPGAPPPDWDVADWVTGDPGGGPAAAGVVPAGVALEPYTAWEGEAPGDPRHAPRPRLMDTLEEVVVTEGPVLAARAYALLNRAAGGKKLTSVARAPLSSAMYWLAKEHRIALTARDEIPWQDDDVARAPDAPTVRVRELGPRELIEVPLDEVAELMRRLRPVHGEDPAALKRAVLGAYGLRRLTARADAYLETAVGLL